MKKFKDFKLNENISNDIYVIFTISGGWDTSIMSFNSQNEAEKYFINKVNNYYNTDIDDFDEAYTHHEENGDGYQIYFEKSKIK